jgi:hypothetical protein
MVGGIVPVNRLPYKYLIKRIQHIAETAIRLAARTSEIVLLRHQYLKESSQ